MALAHVSRDVAGSTAAAASVATPGRSHTAGNLLTAVISCNTGSGEAVTGVTDTAGNTYHHAGSSTSDGVNRLDIWYAYNITGNAANVVTAAFSGTPIYRVIVVHEFSGFTTSDPYNAQAGTSGSGTAMSTGSVSVTGTDAVIVALFLNNSNSIVDTVPAYNTTAFNATGDPVAYFADGYRIVTASEAAVATGANTAWLATAAAFQLAAATVSPSAPDTYTAWAAKVSTTRIVLAEVQVGESLHGFTATGGAAYTVPYSRFTHPAALRRDLGLYRGLDSVYVSGTAQSLATSVANCQATASSYFLDTSVSPSLLYVHTSTGANPDTFAIVEARFTLRMATDPVSFSDQTPYDVRLSGQSLPSLLTEQSDPLLGVNVYPSGGVEFVNADGLFDSLSSRYNWTNRTVTFKVGGGTMVYSDYATIAVMQAVQPPAAKSDVAILQLRALSNATDAAFPQNLFNDYDATSSITQGLTGRYMPMLFGYGFSMPLTLLIPGGGAAGFENRYVAIDPRQIGTEAQLAVTALYATPMAGGTRQTVPTTDYNNLTLGTIDIDQTNWPYTDWAFTFDGYTYTFGSITTPLWQTFGSIAKVILTGGAHFPGCGVPTAQIDTAAFTQADTDAPQLLGLYIAGGSDASTFVTGQELINQIERSVLGSVNVSATFIYTAKVWNPAFTVASLTTLNESDFFTFEEDEQAREDLSPTVVVRYLAATTDGVASTSATTTEAASRLNTAKTLTIDTRLASASDAALMAARMRLIASLPTRRFNVEMPPRMLNAAPWDKIRVQRSRGPSTSTTATTIDLILEAVTQDKRLADVMVAGAYGNQRGLGNHIRCVVADTEPTWASANTNSRLNDAFAVDDTTHLAAAGDASSFEPGWVY